EEEDADGCLLPLSLSGLLGYEALLLDYARETSLGARKNAAQVPTTLTFKHKTDARAMAPSLSLGLGCSTVEDL
ncbi:hypothetical protein THAOC_24357, partial [Thalassiosira oceanica]